MRIVVFLVFGLVIGAIVGVVLPGRNPLGWVLSMVVGAAGAMVGGLLGSALGLNTESSRWGFVVSVLGAACWLALYHLIRHRAGSPPRGGPPSHGRRSTDVGW